MESIRFLNWQLEVDPVATRDAQEAREGGAPESCACLPCRNFAAARNVAYPPDFLHLLERLGIPRDRESEIYHCGEVEPGYHVYGGWFHFVGRVAAGPEAQLESSIELATVASRFAMGFTRKLALVPESFPPDDITQLEFSATVPWILSEPCAE